MWSCCLMRNCSSSAALAASVMPAPNTGLTLHTASPNTAKRFGNAAYESNARKRDGGTDVLWGCYAFEVKRRKAIAGLYEWLAQADKGKGVPVAACRADGKEMLIVMRFQDWATLVRESLNA